MFKEGCPQCPYCGRFNTTYNPYLGNYKHWCYCGQALDWSAEEDWNKKQEALNKAKVVKCGEIHWHDCIIGVEDTHCPNHISTPFSKDDNHYGLILLDKSYWEENKWLIELSWLVA
jgi:hypothetical protein